MINSFTLKNIKREDNIIMDVRNLFRFKIGNNCNTIKDVTNLFRLKKESKAFKDRIIKILEY